MIAPDPSQQITLVDAIDAVLPQTQCGQCGYAACRPYAVAISEGRAGINQCPPGGAEGIRELASLLGIAPLPLDPEHGPTKPRALAFIDEARCIGCALCLPVCPVDAIVGSAKRMHTVIALECTGCELCLPVCPVECIVMQPAEIESAAVRKGAAALARSRYLFREFRRARQEQEAAERWAGTLHRSLPAQRD